ncbi:hypothetical protein EcWSU1_03439 [Enterobacter ludwigii]|uniref:Uncharacterized protein n=1 Tax=Enterobacter ludwigii TaxID=299767 RepID=G8LNY2_9ENTR|nr:hypothetical protein EcWSU1_03439 [Enterobacter ludwigii]
MKIFILLLTLIVVLIFSHTLLSVMLKNILLVKRRKKPKKNKLKKSDVLKFKYDIFVKDTISLNENTSIFLAEYDKNHNTHSLSKTLFTIAEKHFLNNEFKNNGSNTLAKKRKP